MPLVQKTLDKVILYANQNLPLMRMGFTPHMKLRIMIAERLFQLYATGKIPMTTMPRKVMPKVAASIYQLILSTAATDPDMENLRKECHIEEGRSRSYVEMSGDLEVYDVLRHVWGVDTSNHAKAVCEDGAYQLIAMGMANNNERALASGIDRLSKLHNDFQQKAEDFGATADTEIDIIADAKLVRADADNLTRSAIENLKKKYGAYIDKQGGIETLLQNDEGVYEPSADEEPEKDYFETIEDEEFARRRN